MNEKTTNKQLKEVVTELLKTDGISYDRWLYEQYIQVISEHSDTIKTSIHHLKAHKGE